MTGFEVSLGDYGSPRFLKGSVFTTGKRIISRFILLEK